LEEVLVYPLTRRKALGAALAGATLVSVSGAGEEGYDKPLAGSWTYRSFINDPDPNLPFNDLEFAVADLRLDDAPFGRLSGRLSFGSDYLGLKGSVTYGNPFTLRFQGVGATAGTIEDGHPWVYDYLGFLAPAWPNGIDQRPAIVGTIVRTVAHSQGKAKAGVVASWIALRQDAAPPPPKDPVETLRGLETSWAAAVGTGDPDRIGRFLADDFLFVGAGGALQDRTQHLGDFRTGKLKVASMQITDSTIHPYESGAAVSTLAAVKGTYDGRDIGGAYRFLDAWLLSQRTWLAVARQQTRVAPA
jgi:Domain of unknown function (DUF4440)